MRPYGGIRSSVTSKDDWLTLIEENEFKSLSQELIRSSYSLEPNEGLLGDFAEYFQDNMDIYLRKKK